MEEKPYEVTTPEGEVISQDDVMFAYTREGRRVVGKEYPNPVPMELPLGFVPQVPLYEQIRDMVRRELSQEAADQGLETAEEADDFDVGEDDDPSTPYEMLFEPMEPWPATKEVIKREQEAVQAVRGGGGAELPSGEQKAAPEPP